MNRREVIGTGLAALGVAGAGPATKGAGEAAGWLDRWLAAFNGPDARTYEAFIRANAPSLVPYLDEDLGLRDASGGFQLISSKAAGDYGIEAVVRDRDWDRFSRVVLTATSDQRIDDLSFSGAQAPEGFAIARGPEGEVLDQLRARLGRLAEAGRWSGAVLVARNGQPLMSEAFGLADPALDIPATVSTRYCIGSMGKMFTAVAIMQLVEAGRVRLADPVGAHIPDYPDRTIADRVTIQHLLTHTGGTGDIFGPEYDARADTLRTPSDFIALYGARPPAFEAGSRWGYSNYGFVLLGAIIEAAAGQAYPDYLRRRVFEPAGMAVTSMSFDDPAPTARPLVGCADIGLKALPPWRGLPAGGGYSTVDDLHAFASALGDGRLIQPATLQRMTTPQVSAGTSDWGLGVALRRRNGVSFYGHGGAAPGVNADLAIYPASGYATVVLSNRGHPHATNVADFLGGRLPA